MSDSRGGVISRGKIVEKRGKWAKIGGEMEGLPRVRDTFLWSPESEVHKVSLPLLHFVNRKSSREPTKQIVTQQKLSYNIKQKKWATRKKFKNFILQQHFLRLTILFLISLIYSISYTQAYYLFLRLKYV